MKIEMRCKNVLITGGGSGIGEAIAKRLFENGANVIICGRSLEKLNVAKERIGAENIHTLEYDISDIGSFGEKISKAQVLIGKIDGFVNAAAVESGQLTGRGYEPWDITEEEWDKISDTDFKAAFFMMRNEINYMLENKIRGNILNIASNAACMDIVGSYGASKLAMIKWTRALGKRYGHHGIILNGIAPGATATPMIERYCKDKNDPYPRHAIERFIKPYEIAELAHYLMSNFGEIICGHTVIADGGDNAATL